MFFCYSLLFYKSILYDYYYYHYYIYGADFVSQVCCPHRANRSQYLQGASHPLLRTGDFIEVLAGRIWMKGGMRRL